MLEQGRLVAAVEEERLIRVKHWAGFPERAVLHCLRESAGGIAGELGGIAIARQPRAHFARKALLAVRRPRSLPRALSRLRNLGAVRQLDDRIARARGAAGARPPLHWVEHHRAHLASAFLCSPWEEALCLSVDGFGDFVSTSLAVGRGTRIDLREQVHFPHSLGVLYTAVTQYLGFPRYGDEYKVMGLAAHGEPSLRGTLARLVPDLGGGRFALDLRYFQHHTRGVAMTWDGGAPALGPLFSPALEGLLGPARGPGEEIGQRHMDIAASLQAVYEDRLFALVRRLQAGTGLDRLTLSGGCAFNSAANGRLLEHCDVRDLYVPPAAGDAGTALGAALHVQHVLRGAPRELVLEHAGWGPSFGEDEIRRALAETFPGSEGKDGIHGDCVIERYPDEGVLLRDTAAAIAAGEIVGWVQGPSEWGPRALGNRSILADPRSPHVRDALNHQVKRREAFRPFAPAVLEERTGDWFSDGRPEPFMNAVRAIRPERRSEIPAVTHVDGTGRLQTVSRRTLPRFWGLIREFERLTGVPILLNTSFNVREPIVNTPAEALQAYLGSGLQRLVLGSVGVRRP